jgi:hypothetical protein
MGHGENNRQQRGGQGGGIVDFVKDADFVGILSKKRNDSSGGVDDPYKAKVQCWLKKDQFYILDLAPDLSPLRGAEFLSLDITRCKVRYQIF